MTWKLGEKYKQTKTGCRMKRKKRCVWIRSINNNLGVINVINALRIQNVSGFIKLPWDILVGGTRNDGWMLTWGKKKKLLIRHPQSLQPNAAAAALTRFRPLPVWGWSSWTWCCHRTSSGGCAWSRFLCCPGEAEKTWSQSHTAGEGPNPKEQSFTYTTGNTGGLRHSSGKSLPFFILQPQPSAFFIGFSCHRQIQKWYILNDIFRRNVFYKVCLLAGLHTHRVTFLPVRLCWAAPKLH